MALAATAAGGLHPAARRGMPGGGHVCRCRGSELQGGVAVGEDLGLQRGCLSFQGGGQAGQLP